MTVAMAPHKRGSTLSYAGTADLPPGTWTATAQINDRTTGVLLGTLTVRLGIRLGTGRVPIEVSATAAQTQTWPIGQHVFDIRFADDSGQVIHTATLVLPVVEAQTRAGL